MEVDLAVLADAANTTNTGKLNILGVFDRLTLGPKFPATSPTFAIVVRIVVHPSEGRKHGLVFRLADADGQEVAKMEAEFEVGRKQPRSRPARIPVIIGSQINFPQPGEYVFDILINGRWERSIPVEVRTAKD